MTGVSGMGEGVGLPEDLWASDKEHPCGSDLGVENLGRKRVYSLSSL